MVRRADECVRALNSLDAPSVPLRSFGPALQPNAAQSSVLDRVMRKVERCGKPPRDMDGCAALSSLLKSKDMYTESAVNVKPYRADKFSVLHSGIQALPLRPRLPDVGVHFYDNADTLICRTAEETEALVDNNDIEPVYPYWDVVLRRSRVKRLDLLKRLMSVGLVGLRLRIRARAALFFVEKKDGSLRLVVDGREASSLHR